MTQSCSYGFSHFIPPSPLVLLSPFALLILTETHDMESHGFNGHVQSQEVKVTHRLCVCMWCLCVIESHVLSITVPTFDNFPEFLLLAINSIAPLCGPWVIYGGLLNISLPSTCVRCRINAFPWSCFTGYSVKWRALKQLHLHLYWPALSLSLSSLLLLLTSFLCHLRLSIKNVLSPKWGRSKAEFLRGGQIRPISLISALASEKTSASLPTPAFDI